MSDFLNNPIETIASWVTPARKKKLVYNLSEGSLNDENILSRKAATLCEAHRLGFSVPPAFILSSEVSQTFNESSSKKFSEDAYQEMIAALADLEKASHCSFGATSGTAQPLLLSVRGGPLVSAMTLMSFEEKSLESVNTDIVDILGAPDSWCIPGIKESCLGIGLNDEVAAHLARLTNPFVAYNTYAHFLVRFGTIVMGAPRRNYRRVLADHVESTGRAGMNLTEEDLKSIVHKFKQIANVPSNPQEQLELAIQEMYRCWFSPAAIEYRSEALGLAKGTGTAVIVQSIVFGGTGVCFSRSPVTGSGEDGAYGTFWSKSGEKLSLQEYKEMDALIVGGLTEISRRLERQFRDMVQFEFVVGDDRNIYLLQVQSGKRTPKAAMKIAVEMVSQEIITEREALMRVDANKVEFFLQQHLHPDQLSSKPFGEGLAASRGVVTATLAFSSAQCLEQSPHGEVILCLQQGTPEDARAMRIAAGVITMDGNLFTNTAILCRGMGKPCITCAKDMHLKQRDDNNQIYLVSSNGQELKAGDEVTLDGGSGKLFVGLKSTVNYSNDSDFQTLLSWADKFRKMRIDGTLSSSGADQKQLAAEVQNALALGADGLGSLSTDGLFSSSETRLALTRSLLIRKEHPEAISHLKKLCEMQREDLRCVFRSLHGRPVAVKLLDKHLGSFLPQSEEDISALASQFDMPVSEIKLSMKHLTDKNPDIGLRGCRVTANYPLITEMQVRAIIGAALDLVGEGIQVVPRILVPMICTVHEFHAVLEVINRTAFQVYDEAKKANEKVGLVSTFYSVGVIFNSPRSCLRAETIAPHVMHVAFNTHDLTMQTFGCDREDAEKFFPQYIFDKIYMADPFKSIDDMAVGALMNAALNKCRTQQPHIECSVTEGDHSSDPRSIEYFQQWNIQAISCPAHRVPLARISAAQAAIRAEIRAFENPMEPEWEDYLFMY